MRKIDFKKYLYFAFVLFVFSYGCNYTTYKTILQEQAEGADDLEPNYDVTLNDDFQNFVTYFYMGNRSEMFGTFFNKFYQALEEYDEAMTDYRLSTIATYNRRLDSLNITPPISSTAREKLTNVLSRCSKIIQYNKSTRFMDDAVLLIGKSYFYQGEYLSAERKFNEFLSKLTKSDLYDEAILYLGKTKLRLGKSQEAETILSNLYKSTLNNEIKSDITQDLALMALARNDYKTAVSQFRNSIELTKEKEKKAEKQYILAKIYSKFIPSEAYIEFRKANEITSDFDLLFYSKLNEAKSLVVIGRVGEALEILDKQNSKYRDYPDMKQLVELEIANTYYSEKKYIDAKKEYYNVILKYPGTKAAADAFFHLAEYSEYVKNDYLFAYVNYKKSAETNNTSDFLKTSLKKTATLDKYFTLVAAVKDSAKIVYPDFEPDFLKYRENWNREKGVEEKEIERREGEQNNPPKLKGSGYSGGLKLDSLGNPDESPEVIQNIDSVSIPKTDSTENLKTSDTTLKTEKEPEVKKMSPEDSLLLAIHIEDSIKVVKQTARVDAYFQLSELFLYELGRSDSALYYLDIIISDSLLPEKTSKAIYTAGTIHKNLGDEEKANEYFRLVVSRYPNTAFANESRKVLGLQLVEIAVDTSMFLFKSAEEYILKNNFEAALNNLKTVLSKSSSGDSVYMKSLYSIGWIYEYGFKNKDSSLSYYKMLKKVYPNSLFAQNLAPKIEFYTTLEKIDSVKKQLRSLGTLPDSLKVIYDSLTYLTDSTGWNMDLTGTSRIKSDSVSVELEKSKKEGKDKNKQENSGETPEMTNPKEQK
ncbi:MAG: tetratricopeptide repeat protein [Ignavibacteriae bacterium]|nr:tetratricopeptide repeat protein [Ignavibacteriota bacterium]